VAEKTAAVKHIGFKSTILMFALILSAVWTMFSFFMVWLPAETITTQMIMNYAIVLVIVFFVWTAIAFLSHMLWKLVFAAEEKQIG
jgi:hypothetical protein